VPTTAIIRAHPAIDALVPETAHVEKVASGFRFTEGPIWLPSGSLLFSDIHGNAVFEYRPGAGVSEFLRPSGCYGRESPDGFSIGSNGLTLDAQGRLVLCEHGNRRITRLERDRSRTVLADRFEGKCLNSPNDLVYDSRGVLYFTDPPYGLLRQDEDPRKELPFNGIFRVANGELELLSTDLDHPNGLAFSPDETVLYVANSSLTRRKWARFEVTSDCRLGAHDVFYDLGDFPEPAAPDGLKLDVRGNLYGAAAGGVWIFSPAGRHLGTIRVPETPANCHWGDRHGKTLYITARTSVYRIRLLVEGIRPSGSGTHNHE
jgi:gluconolactonase